MASVQLSTVCVSLVSMSTIEGVSFGWGGICVGGSRLSGVVSWISGSDVGLNSVKGRSGLVLVGLGISLGSLLSWLSHGMFSCSDHCGLLR